MLYKIIEHVFLETGFPVHACLFGAAIILLSIYWEELTK